MTKTETKTGTATTFEHITATLDPAKLRSGEHSLLAVQFDGELEFWATTDETLGRAELMAYYAADWEGTGRILPLLVFAAVDGASIQCTPPAAFKTVAG